ncbi:putative endonuclease 4 [Mycoplasmopsis californica]|uniref:Probable endonuclease 4 n=1 Tax=Mycoplasmopsis equigenitalium TaxID=114883 RepID=A0ABY5J558_9BACT|nr:deoxyribonuclease IV [Mycoplasmopsis equigenitalium]UUD36833.1 deoxyribonuclease IV [Mycoplasmopsis equigenitalium]VEU69871.1 putative endonuclease 4 [Mycoplasmopsis californica]
MIKLGSHIPFKSPDYLYGSGLESKKNNANTMMIYLGPPQSTIRVPVEKYKLDEYLTAFGKMIDVKDIVVHAPYIVNPSNPEKTVFARDFLIKEINRMNYIGCKYLVLHPGAFTSFEVKVCLDTLVTNLNYIFSKTKDVHILLETMSGKGTEVGRNYDELLYVINKVNNERLGICLDTCHVWDAGYNIKNLDRFIDELKTKGILEYIKVVHLNDSKNDINSHKDRHANIGQGFIGTDILKELVHHPEFDNIPIILETPWTETGPIYEQEIKLLLS